MAWTIEYDRRVIKELKKLDRKIQHQVLDFFDKRISPSSDPRDSGKPLTSTFSGLWRYRMGDYRAVCRIEDKKLRVLVVRVAHRNKVYKVPNKMGNN